MGFQWILVEKLDMLQASRLSIYSKQVDLLQTKLIY